MDTTHGERDTTASAASGGGGRPGGGGRRGVYAWLNARYDLDGIARFARHKTVPVGAHATAWYYLGGLSMFLFAVQLVSGALLLMHYQAGEETSYESLKRIVTNVPFGWLVRAVHCWSAHIMVICVIVHMFSTYFTKAYRHRELTWLSGMALFGLTLGFGFSGYLLPWNELAFFATAVGTDSAKAVPGIGHWLVQVMRGGEDVSIRTLYRFFALHVSILPLVGFALVGFHLLLIQRQGMAEPLPHLPGAPAPKIHRMPFFPHFALRDALLWLVTLNGIALLAVLWPYGPGVPGAEWHLGEKADPLMPAYPGIKPEWYFLWVFQLLREMPPHVAGIEGPAVAVGISALVVGLWTIVPFIDRRATRGEPSPWFTDLGVAAICFVGYLTLKGWDISPARCAAITLAIGIGTSGARMVAGRHAAVALTGSAALLAGLDGLTSLGWLKSAWISLGALVALGGPLALLGRRGGGGVGGSGGVAGAGRTAALGVALALALGGVGGLALARQARAQEAGASLDEMLGHREFRALLDGAGPAARERFDLLSLRTQRLLYRAATDVELLSSSDQMAAFLAPTFSEEQLGLALVDNCILCHTNSDLLDSAKDDRLLFRLGRSADRPNAHLDLGEALLDVHFQRGLSCSGCHGGSPDDLEMTPGMRKRWPSAATRRVDRSWIPAFCGTCHSDPAVMRKYDPALPVDQLVKYREGPHGERLLGAAKDSKAAQCVSCHGVHGIRPPGSPRSKVHPQNVAATCGACHADPGYMAGRKLEDGRPLPTNQFAEWGASVHGLAMLEKGDLGAPTCNDCHGAHASMPTALSHVTEVCRTCHGRQGELFDQSPHKAAFEKAGWAECGSCHGDHEVTHTSDRMLDPVGGVCVDCHAQHGNEQCASSVRLFSERISGIRTARAQAVEAIQRAERLGMPTEDLRFDLAALDDALVEVRVQVHSFNDDAMEKISGQARGRADVLEQSARARADEYAYRRSGLLVSTLLITVVGGLLLARIRRLPPYDRG